jgi:RNA binding exosome subunit
MQSEIQAVEISYIIHATEDVERVFRGVTERLGVSQPPRTDELEGHFGNKILYVSYHLTGEEATRAFRSTISLLGSGGRRELLANLEDSLDEHKVLYIRIAKQDFLRGVALLSPVDSIRIKVRPRGYMKKADVKSFYSRLLELAA